MSGADSTTDVTGRYEAHSLSIADHCFTLPRGSGAAFFLCLDVRRTCETAVRLFFASLIGIASKWDR